MGYYRTFAQPSYPDAFKHLIILTSHFNRPLLAELRRWKGAIAYIHFTVAPKPGLPSAFFFASWSEKSPPPPR